MSVRETPAWAACLVLGLLSIAILIVGAIALGLLIRLVLTAAGFV